jgi:hypothetical protein
MNSCAPEGLVVPALPLPQVVLLVCYCMSFLLWSLYCLSFNSMLLITPLVSSSLSLYEWWQFMEGRKMSCLQSNVFLNQILYFSITISTRKIFVHIPVLTVVSLFSSHISVALFSLEMPVPSQGHYGFHSFPVVDWFCLFINLWVLTFPLLDCSGFGNFVITFIRHSPWYLPLSLRLKVSGCHYNSIYNDTWTKQVKQLSNQRQMSKTISSEKQATGQGL